MSTDGGIRCHYMGMIEVHKPSGTFNAGLVFLRSRCSDEFGKTGIGWLAFPEADLTILYCFVFKDSY